MKNSTAAKSLRRTGPNGFRARPAKGCFSSPWKTRSFLENLTLIISPVLSLLLQPESPISQSGNIALYPSLCPAEDGTAACAWYEYTSPDRPTRSDLWFARQQPGGAWGKPHNVSGGTSYNNGPSLAHDPCRGFVVAWHSWRPPGREPFSRDGDRYNIWLSSSADGFSWEEAELPFPEHPQSKYAALAISRGTCFLAFSRQDTKAIWLSSSCAGRRWAPPEPLSARAARFPSLASDAKGSLLIAFSVPEENGLWLSRSDDGKNWSRAVQVLEESGHQLTKPKVSVDSAGAIWIACQTENWGSFSRRFRIRGAGDVLEIALATAGGAGNAVWAVNAIILSDPEGRELKRILFGPAVQDDLPEAIRIGSGNWEWDKSTRCGFDAPVQEILRELGTDITRSMVYCDSPRKLRIAADSVEMDVEIIFSSWVAARPALAIAFNMDSWETKTPPPRGDQCFLFRSKDAKHFDLVAETSPTEDHSRPSAVCETAPGRFLAAWTSFDGSTVQIVSQNLTIP